MRQRSLHVVVIMSEQPEPDSLENADPVEHREAWDKKSDESVKAFSAFCLYRDAEKRSFKTIADSLKCSTQNIWQWSSRHNWKLRCDAFDVENERLQRVEFSRNRVRMRERHLAVAQAMLGVAAHGLKEWQSRIASGSALNLQPEQIALLTKCATELERSTLGIDGDDHRPPVINVIMGVHAYDDEKAGDSGVVDGDDEGEVEYMTWQDAERRRYERMSPEERAASDVWKVPPTPKQLN